MLNALRRTDPRTVLTGLLIMAICAAFWAGSRYPSLQGKAGADPDDALATPLGFERYFSEPASDSPVARVLWTAAEWAWTNRKGMAFGLLLAAGMLTLVPLLRRRVGGGKLTGALQGVLIGTPLGVCVNCAAPVGQAMIHAGSRVETALATMFASPSFNVIVLGILLTLFPWYLVAIKLVCSLLMVLVCVPWLAKLAERPGWRRPLGPPPKLPGLALFQRLDQAFARTSVGDTVATQAPKSLVAAAAWVARHYAKNLWLIVCLALPMMLLAGLLGAVMVELLPWDQIAGLARVQGLGQMAFLLILVTAFGVLLPVPIAFDVIVCAVLWGAGVPAFVVAPLLVTLGLYSIYPMGLLGASLSWRIALLAALAVFLLGLGAGAVATALDRWHELRQVQAMRALLAEIEPPAPASLILPTGKAATLLDGLARPLQGGQTLSSSGGTRLDWAPFRSPSAKPGTPVFTRLDGPLVGFERLPLPRPYQTMQPGIMHLGGLSAGDVNGDGWPDVAVGTPFGVLLYRNLGGRFALQKIDFAPMTDWAIADVALVDLNGDGALDLFFSTWMQGSHILYNVGGTFSAEHHAHLPRGSETAVRVAAFADVDRDGDLDIATGGSTFVPRFFYPATAKNALWMNTPQGFTRQPLPGPEGDTLALLFTDLDADGWPDLLVGNDFDEPDHVFMNRKGHLTAVLADASPLPKSTTTTMSFDSGDLDNDGKDELYIGEIAMGRIDELAGRLAGAVISCDLYQAPADRARCDRTARFQNAVIQARNTGSLAACRKLARPLDQRDCAVSAYHWHRVLVRLPVLGADKAGILKECAKVPPDFTTMHDICSALVDSPMDHERSDEMFPDEIPSIKQTNLLFAPGADGLEDVTGPWSASFGGWSWSARFADLNNDAWQDLYVAQGTRLRPGSASAIYYRNTGGRSFEDATRASGLTDHRPTGAALMMDFDLDGDLDLITYPFLLTPVVWRNDAPAGQAISLQLRDETVANGDAVGAKITLHWPDGRLQTRRIKASGGYQSHDRLSAHFGLGDWGPPHAIDVSWPDGLATKLQQGDLLPGRYTVVRAAPDG